MGAEDFRRAGDVIFGQEWQRPMSRALGPLHPDGPRESIDERLVRRWASGDREIPVWVSAAIVRVAGERAAALRREADAMDAFAAGMASTVPRGQD